MIQAGQLESSSVRTPSPGGPSVRTDLDAFGRTQFTYAHERGAAQHGSLTTTDTDNPFDASPTTSSWRYRFNRVGDLVGVRDPRGCGQNFIYDLGGRLLGEQYVSCAESQTAAGDGPVADVPGGISETVFTGTTLVDVRYEYDEYPTWVEELVGIAPPSVGGASGRATGVTDRGQRSAVAYDHRGNAVTV